MNLGAPSNYSKFSSKFNPLKICLLNSSQLISLRLLRKGYWEKGIEKKGGIKQHRVHILHSDWEGKITVELTAFSF
jgi:hypothetical protein